ncbi:hypothetical protein ACFX12_017325 [Malus domestica]
MAPLVKNQVEPLHAKILAIGTANPPNVYYQEDYPDFLFRVTKNEHRTDLREKFDRICEKSRTKKRYLHLKRFYRLTQAYIPMEPRHSMCAKTC